MGERTDTRRGGTVPRNIADARFVEWRYSYDPTLQDSPSRHPFMILHDSMAWHSRRMSIVLRLSKNVDVPRPTTIIWDRRSRKSDGKASSESFSDVRCARSSLAGCTEGQDGFVRR